eukprot:5011989-Pyramimonas_sp.AAC.2
MSLPVRALVLRHHLMATIAPPARRCCAWRVLPPLGGPVICCERNISEQQVSRAQCGAAEQSAAWCSKAREYSHGGPIGRVKRGYILTTDQSDVTLHSGTQSVGTAGYSAAQ